MPDCPVHLKPMRAGDQPGNFFCTAFIGVGLPGTNKKGYCSQAINPPRGPRQNFATPAAPPPFEASIPSQSATTEALALSALHFAGGVFHGIGNAEAAMDLAERAHEFLKGAQ